MKKAAMVWLGFLFTVTFFTHGKVLAEQAEPVAGSAEASVTMPEAPETYSDSLSEDTVPVDEELRDEEVIDADA